MWRNALAILAFLVAAVIAFLEPAQLMKSAPTPQKPVGHVRSVSGQVQAEAPRATRGNLQTNSRTSLVTNDRPLGAQETLDVGPSSEAKVEFLDGLQLRLPENSRIAADFEAGTGDRINVTVLRGDVDIVNPGSGKTRVFKDGELLTPKTASQGASNPVISVTPGAPAPVEEPALTATIPDEPSPTPAPAPGPPRVLPPKVGAKPALTPGLSNEEISRVLGQQNSRFQRCYVGHMNRTGQPRLVGTIKVAFQIATTGKVSDTRIVQTPFNEVTLNTCLLEVVSRTVFPAFEGEPVTVNEFPITAE